MGDILGRAPTGSGKTLAFLIPSIELLYRAGIVSNDGTSVLVISPTRELTLQTFGVARKIMKYHSQTRGVIMGGTNRKNEVERLSLGVNLLVSTPGRLLDHLKTTKNFEYRNIAFMIIDEADRVLQIGFESELSQIIYIL